jgi:hypothetical protein
MNNFHRTSNTNRFVQSAATQYVDASLALPSAGADVTVNLGPLVFFEPGPYVLFDYSQSTAVTPFTGDSSKLALDGSDLVSASSPSLVHSVSERKIYVGLLGVASNGTQFVDGTLTIGGSTTIYLAAELYRAPGTYTLFSYTTLVGSITNLIIVPSAGRSIDTSVSANGCAAVGSTITVTLV